LSKPNLIKEARQKQLIEATISSIGRHGYAGTTLNHVAGAAGLSPGIVNFYFKSKDQLLAATLAKLAEEYESFWMAAIEASRQSPAAGL
jgi:TetR/AcrR family transcriptional repressor of bet genes